VDAFRTDIDDNSEFDCIVDACRQLFQNRFQNSHVEFNMKQANRVAHELAHVASYNVGFHTYNDVL